MPTTACAADGTVCATNERCVPRLFDEPRVYAAGSELSALELRDLNDDDHLDAIVLQSIEHGGVLTFLGAGDGTFAPPLTSPTARGGWDLAAGDFDGDGRIDIVFAGQSATVLLGDANGTFAHEIPVAGEAFAVVAGDVDRDENLDFVTLSFNEGAARVHRGDGRGGFESGVPISVTSKGQPRDLALADLDGNSELDLAVASLGESTVNVLRGLGEGTFSEFASFDTLGGDPWSILLSDWNGDGKLDAATGNDFSENVSVLFGADAGTFETARTYPAGTAPDALASGDFDGDGRRDLAVAHTNGAVDTVFAKVLLGVGDGAFAEPRDFAIGHVTFLPGATFYAISAGDLNEDGRDDLVATNALGGELVVLLSTPFGRCEPAQ